MNDNAKKWVAALRSGEFGQTFNHLRDNGRYCCLGVACELYSREHPEAGWDGDGAFRADAADEGDFAHLPPAVRDWLGLSDVAGKYEAPDVAGVWLTELDDLTGLNDDRAYSFERIAGVIESEPEGLFVR